MLKKRINLFGVLIDDIPLERALSIASEALEGGVQTSFFTPNLEFLASACKNEGVRALINSASVNLPDGVGLRLVAFLLGLPMENTVAGIDFGEALIALAEKEGRGIFLLGSREEAVQRAAENLKKRHPRLNICGTHHGFFGDDELDSACREISGSKGEILIVCRGFPLQERFVFDARAKLSNVKIFACLGGSIDVWAGECRRAPLIMRELRLEWLWRIINEPKRLKKFIFSLSVLWKSVLKFLCVSELTAKKEHIIK